ncbi:MAG: putative cytokinetic ring protein SteA [Actinomycetota bacterium]|nr:putative cytokinetic ring protein SteA [Actinomycetota bacterium]
MSTKAVARIDKRTKNLVKRLSTGEIAIIDHLDLDEVSAESLLEKKVSAVVNADKFNSGRYPNTGPLLLAAAGVALIDDVGPEIFDRVSEGDVVTIEGGNVSKGGRLIARGEALDADKIRAIMEEARASISTQLEKFAVNTLDYVSREKGTYLGGLDLPEIKTPFSGRHALVVVRGYDYKVDLAALRSYIREMRPVLVGVDGGADALLEERLRPDMIIGDMDSVSDQALRSGAELICQAYTDGRAPGKARLEELGVEHSLVQAGGTSEDIALLIAHQMGAELIVAVGTHGHLVEFLDKGREGMASTFLARLKVGDRLLDAKGVNQLYRSSPKLSHLVVLIFAALTTITVVIMKTPARLYLSTLLVKLKLLLGV